jgi:DNA-binding FadR family transcriptional regulator
VAHAEIVDLLADSAADPLLVLLALIRERDADGARQEMEQHVEGLRSAAI